MATDNYSNHEASVTTLVSGIINDAQALINQQFALLKHEVREDLRRTKQAAIICLGGAAFATIAALLFAFALAHLLFWLAVDLPLWSCYGICAIVFLAIALGLVWTGFARFRSFNPLPDQSAKALKENVQWITNPK